MLRAAFERHLPGGAPEGLALDDLTTAWEAICAFILDRLRNKQAVRLSDDLGDITWTKSWTPTFVPSKKFLRLYPGVRVKKPLPVGAIRTNLVPKPVSAFVCGPDMRDCVKATLFSVSHAFGSVAASRKAATLPIGTTCSLECAGGAVDFSHPQRLRGEPRAPPQKPPPVPRLALPSGGSPGPGSYRSTPRRSQTASARTAPSTRTPPSTRSKASSRAPPRPPQTVTELLGPTAAPVQRALTRISNFLHGFTALDRTATGHVSVTDIVDAGTAFGVPVTTAEARDTIAACAKVKDGIPAAYATVVELGRLVLTGRGRGKGCRRLCDALLRGWVGDEDTPTASVAPAHVEALATLTLPWLSNRLVATVVGAATVDGPTLGMPPVVDHCKLATVVDCLDDVQDAAVTPHGRPSTTIPPWVLGVGDITQRQGIVDVFDALYGARMTPRAAFTLMDGDSDGKVSLSDMSVALTELGAFVSSRSLQTFFDAADVDRTGTLSQHQFTAAFGPEADMVDVTLDAIRTYLYDRGLSPTESFGFMLDSGGARSRTLLDRDAFVGAVKRMERTALLSLAQLDHVWAMVCGKRGRDLLDAEAWCVAMFASQGRAWQDVAWGRLRDRLYAARRTVGEFLADMRARAPPTFQGHVPVMVAADHMASALPSLASREAEELAASLSTRGIVDMSALRDKLVGPKLAPGWQDDVFSKIRESGTDAMDSLLDIVRAMDMSGAGSISPADFRESLTTLGIALDMSAMDALFRFADNNADGTLSYEELMGAITKTGQAPIPHLKMLREIQLAAANQDLPITELFDHLDTSGTRFLQPGAVRFGLLSTLRLSYALKDVIACLFTVDGARVDGLTPAAWQRMFAALDPSGASGVPVGAQNAHKLRLRFPASDVEAAMAKAGRAKEPPAELSPESAAARRRLCAALHAAHVSLTGWFAEMDGDRDGFITRKDFVRAVSVGRSQPGALETHGVDLRQVRITPEDAGAMFDVEDVNGTGFLGRPAFLAAVAAPQEPQVDDVITSVKAWVEEVAEGTAGVADAVAKAFACVAKGADTVESAAEFRVGLASLGCEPEPSVGDAEVLFYLCGAEGPQGVTLPGFRRVFTPTRPTWDWQAAACVALGCHLASTFPDADTAFDAHASFDVVQASRLAHSGRQAGLTLSEKAWEEVLATLGARRGLTREDFHAEFGPAFAIPPTSHLSTLFPRGARGAAAQRALFRHVAPSGSMDASQFVAALALAGAQVPEEEVAAAWAGADALSTGHIELKAFRRVFAPPPPPLDFVHLSLQRLRRLIAASDTHLGAVFAALDTNGDGILTVGEVEAAVMRLLPSVSPVGVRVLFAALDMDTSHTVDTAEFGLLRTLRTEAAVDAERRHLRLSRLAGIMHEVYGGAKAAFRVLGGRRALTQGGVVRAVKEVCVAGRLTELPPAGVLEEVARDVCGEAAEVDEARWLEVFTKQ